MKKLLAVLLLIFFLTGCTGAEQMMDKAISMREKLLSSQGCMFDAVITADYGEKLHKFSMRCQADAHGALAFTVSYPETISGITGTISAGEGKLTFENNVLVFELLADGQVTPVSAPWLMIKTLRSGYLSACAKTENGYRLSIDDSYEEDALHIDFWTTEDVIPIHAEIVWQGRRILSMEIKNFTYM
jgi:outer membrane lipoprotein-sorting protein